MVAQCSLTVLCNSTHRFTYLVLNRAEVQFSDVLGSLPRSQLRGVTDWFVLTLLCQHYYEATYPWCALKSLVSSVSVENPVIPSWNQFLKEFLHTRVIEAQLNCCFNVAPSRRVTT